MSSRSQVTRQGVVIGEHDEQTLLALLNAGALRLTDTYWHRGMTSPVPLAELLCGGSRQARRARIRNGLTIMAVLTSLVATCLWLHAAPVPDAALIPELLTAPPRPGTAPEIRRATPVITGHLVLDSSPPAEPDFPVQSIAPVAAHSQVAVLALDDQQHPLNLGAGVVVGDGSQVLASLRTVAGTSAIELHLADGSVQRPAQVTVSVAAGLAVFALQSPGIPLGWASAPVETRDRLCVAGHGLNDDWQSPVVRVAETLSDQQHVRYRVEQSFSPSLNGGAVLNVMGDLAGVVVDAGAGLILRAADARRQLHSGIPGSLESLAALPSIRPSLALEVVETTVNEGQVLVTLRNRGDHPLNHVLLHLACYEAPPETAEVAQLQERLRSAAVQASLVPDDAADASLAARQALREVTARLESASARLRASQPAAQGRILDQQLLAVDASFPPGMPVSVAIDLKASSNWGAMATVLDAGT